MAEKATFVSSSGDNSATPRQRWALYCTTKQDYREVVISKEEASEILGRYLNKGSVMDNFREIYNEAHMAGEAAVTKYVAEGKLVGMVVSQHENMMDDSSPVVMREFVADGPCGFAWIDVRPRNCAFAKWLMEQKIGSNSDYDKSIKIWVHFYGQSIQKKEIYADAFAEVLRSHKIKAFSTSRMD